MAKGCSLPRSQKPASFGFSRVVGRLGQVRGANHAQACHPGVVATDDVRPSLESVREPEYQMVVPHVATLVARPEESLLLVDLPPPSQGPSSDPAVGRTDTSIDAFRWVGKWQRIHSTPISVSKSAGYGVPPELIVKDGLIGTSDLQTSFMDALATGVDLPRSA